MPKNGRPRSLRSEAAIAASETVRTELTGPDPGVMDTGENAQARVEGKPKQVKAIALLNAPACGVAVTVIFPDPPEEIVRAEGLDPRDTVPPPVVPFSQVEVKLTGLEI